MDAKRQAKGQRSHADYSQNDRAVQILSLEYQALRDEMVMRLSSRYQFLGFTTTAAALLTAAGGTSPLGLNKWLISALAAGVFIFGLACFFILGRIVANLTVRIADIEQRINALGPVQPGEPALLSWVTEHEQRGPLKSINFGISPRRSMTTRKRGDGSPL